MPLTPEQQARQQIDVALAEAGWVVQDRDEMNLAAGLGVAVREFRMAPGHGFADYMLFVDGQAAGVLEAKPVGYTLSSVELQADKYATGLPAGLNPPVNPLSFLTSAPVSRPGSSTASIRIRRVAASRTSRTFTGRKRWRSRSRPRRSMPGPSAFTWRAEASTRRPTKRVRRRCAVASRRCAA